VLLHPPNAPRHASRELRDLPFVVGDHTVHLELAHQRPLLDRHQLDARSFQSLLRSKADRPGVGCFHHRFIARGRGVSTDSLEASAKAFLAATNRLALGGGPRLHPQRA
jgi:hypothetical protein